MDLLYSLKDIEERRRDSVLASPTDRDRLPLPSVACIVPRFSIPSQSDPGRLRACLVADATARYHRLNGRAACLPMVMNSLSPACIAAQAAAGMAPAAYLAQARRSIADAAAALGIAADGAVHVPSGATHLVAAHQRLFLDLWNDKLVSRRTRLQSATCGGCRTSLVMLSPEQTRCPACGREAPWAHGGPWLFRGARIADDVLDSTKAAKWPMLLKREQRLLIGRRPGIEISFKIGNRFQGQYGDLPVFVDRPECLLAMTFLYIRPDHPALDALVDSFYREELQAYRARVLQLPLRLRNNPKLGAALTGIHTINPVTLDHMPVLASAHVPPGHDGLIGVPGYCDFDAAIARTHALVARKPFGPGDREGPRLDAVSIEPGRYHGQTARALREAIEEALVTRAIARRMVRHNVRSVVCSTERTPGIPVPLAACPACGEIPIDTLPFLAGGSPEDGVWHGLRADGPTPCPRCGAPANPSPYSLDWRTELLDPVLDILSRQPQGAGDLECIVFLQPTDHAYPFVTVRAIMHALKKHVPFLEQRPFRDVRCVAPASASLDDVLRLAASWGSDPVRMALLAGSNPEQRLVLTEAAIKGARKTLARLMIACRRKRSSAQSPSLPVAIERDRMLRDVAREFPRGALHRAFTAIVRCVRFLAGPGVEADAIDARTWQALACCLYPFAPHHAAELYAAAAGGASIHNAAWPEAPEAAPPAESVAIAVFIEGRLRDRFTCPPGTARTELGRMALGRKRVRDLLGNRRVKFIFSVEDYLVNIVPDEDGTPPQEAPAAAPA